MEICNVCYSVSTQTVSVKTYEQVLRVNFGLENIKLKTICTWCKTILEKIIKFIKMVKNSNKLINNEVLEDNIYNLSIHKNEAIDITPYNEIYLQDIEDNLEDSNLVEDFKEDNTDSDKTVKYKEMQFNVKFLSIKEQKEEIENKKMSEKYLKMPYKCQKCGISFLTQDVFDEHYKRHIEAFGPYSCKVCDLRFKSPLVMSQHLLSHSRQFVCTICDSIVKRWSQATCHRLKCDFVNNISVCEFCKKIFDNKHSLQVHIKGVHSDNKKYICNYCGGKFGTRQRLTVHIRSHTGLKPFTCDVCNKKFTTNSNLKSHQSVHLEIKTHYCVECNTSYKSQKSLKKHYLESKKHVRDCERRFSCTMCVKKFTTERSLSSHMKVRHMTHYECDVCKKKFSSNSNLKKHIRCIHVSSN